MPTARTLSALLMIAGLAGHLYAAHAIGGSGTAYLHHVAGFALILVLSAAVLTGLGRLLWRDRPGATWLAVGVIQAAFGAWMALEPLAAIG